MRKKIRSDGIVEMPIEHCSCYMRPPLWLICEKTTLSLCHRTISITHRKYAGTGNEKICWTNKRIKLLNKLRTHIVSIAAECWQRCTSSLRWLHEERSHKFRGQRIVHYVETREKRRPGPHRCTVHIYDSVSIRPKTMPSPPIDFHSRNESTPAVNWRDPKWWTINTLWSSETLTP